MAIDIQKSTLEFRECKWEDTEDRFRRSFVVIESRVSSALKTCMIVTVTHKGYRKERE